MALIPEIPTTLNKETNVKENTKLKAHHTAAQRPSPTSIALAGINSTVIEIVLFTYLGTYGNTHTRTVRHKTTIIKLDTVELGIKNRKNKNPLGFKIQIVDDQLHIYVLNHRQNKNKLDFKNQKIG